MSISPTFYENLLCTKVFCTAFMCWQFRFVIFCWKEIVAKAACKMLVNFTTGRHLQLRIEKHKAPGPVFPSSQWHTYSHTHTHTHALTHTHTHTHILVYTHALDSGYLACHLHSFRQIFIESFRHFYAHGDCGMAICVSIVLIASLLSNKGQFTKQTHLHT